MSEQAQAVPQGVDLAQAYLDMVAQLRDAKAENAKLKTAGQARLTLKIGEKGALSVYGMGRFPVTLYRSQWERLIAIVPQIEAFIVANVDKLAVKE